MNISFIQHTGAERLILIFAGWGMDAAPFAGLSRNGYDIAVVWDYTCETADATPLRRYREVVVVAWSLGVMSAARTLPGMSLPVTLAIAVNGTLAPADDELGIPVAVFDGTLAGLCDVTLRKFRRRMCGSAVAYSRFEQTVPQRTLESLRAELSALRLRASGAVRADIKWNLALIGDSDMIFPAANQLRAWTGVKTAVMERTPHLPDFSDIIDRYIVDKCLVADRFGTTRRSYDGSAEVQREVAARLLDKWMQATARRSYCNAVEVGAGTGMFTRMYVPSIAVDSLELWDIAPVAVDGVACRCVTADAETYINTLDNASVDLIVTSSTLQWFNSPAMFVRNAARAMRHGGIFALSFFGTGTLAGLRRFNGLSLNYVSADEMVDVARENFDILHISEDEIVEQYDTVAGALQHLRAAGVNGVRRVPLSVGDMRRLLDDDSLRRLVYRPVYMILQRKL